MYNFVIDLYFAALTTLTAIGILFIVSMIRIKNEKICVSTARAMPASEFARKLIKVRDLTNERQYYIDMMLKVLVILLLTRLALYFIG
jgi:hypothetical protein